MSREETGVVWWTEGENTTFYRPQRDIVVRKQKWNSVNDME